MDDIVLLNELIYQMRRNYPEYPSTFGNCSTKACNESGRGAGKCAKCCEKGIADITGLPHEAEVFHMQTKSNARLVGSFKKQIEEA